MCTNFNNYFIAAFYNELQKKVLYNPPPRLKSVAALTCKIWMFNCTTLHDSYSFKRVTNRVFTVNIYGNVIFWIVCLCQLIYDITNAFKISVISMHTYFASCTPFCQWLRQWRIVAMSRGREKRVACITVAIYCADMMSNDVVCTQERQISSSKSIKQKYLLVYYSERKLLSEVIILANINGQLYIWTFKFRKVMRQHI